MNQSEISTPTNLESKPSQKGSQFGVRVGLLFLFFGLLWFNASGGRLSQMFDSAELTGSLLYMLEFLAITSFVWVPIFLVTLVVGLIIKNKKATFSVFNLILLILVIILALPLLYQLYQWLFLGHPISNSFLEKAPPKLEIN